MTMRFSSWLFGLVVMVAIATACGPSEAEVERIVAHAVEGSEALMRIKHYSRAEAAQMVDDAVAESEIRMRTEFDNRLGQQDNDHRALLVEQTDWGLDLLDLVEQIRDTHQANRDIFVERDRVLERAICETDYWVNSTRSMVWYSLDHVTGGPTTLEEAQGFWVGIAVPDDYGQTISVICDVGGEGQWVLKSNVLRVTENVQAR